MGIIRDLWNDPDPLKWVVFGGAGVSVVLAGVLYWQNGQISDMVATIASYERMPRKEGDPAPVGSLQALVDQADQLAGFTKQIEDDPFANDAGDDPASYASAYVIKSGAGAYIPDPKTSTTVKGGGSGYTDTEISVSFPGQKSSYPRENIKAFIFNMERSPLVVCTYLSLTPAERNHRPGQTLAVENEQWIFESKFTVRRPKIAAPGK